MTQDRSRERQVNRCRARSSLFQRRAFVYTYTVKRRHRIYGHDTLAILWIQLVLS